MTLPDNIFFTGVPGSRWSGIAQILEQHESINITDQNKDRVYTSSKYGGHVGSYFGTGMEFEANCSFTDEAYSDPSAGTKIVKSHEWAYDLKGIDIYRVQKKGDWIMLVYRPDLISYAWWFEAGGFKITYPNYDWYEGPERMLYEIQMQNKKMLTYAAEHKCTWNYFTPEWVKETMGIDIDFSDRRPDILVTMIKPNV